MKKHLDLTVFLVVLMIAVAAPASTRLTASQLTAAATQAGTAATAGSHCRWAVFKHEVAV